MKVLLDTDICVELIRQRSPQILRRLKRYSPADVGVSSITLAELAYGAAKSAEPERNQTALNKFAGALEVAPFDDLAARQYGEIRAKLQKQGIVIRSLDMLIGAHAVSIGVTLVTHNTREFSRIQGLRLVDWIAE